MSTPKVHTDPKIAAPSAAASSSRAVQAPVPAAQIPAGVVQLMAADPQQRMPQQMAPDDIGYLQRTTGNRAVAQMLGRTTPPASKSPKAPRPVIQASLEVGGADDRYEREADQIARRVNSAGASSGTGKPSGTGNPSGGRRSAPRPQSGTGAQISRLQRAPVIGREGGVADSGIEGRVRSSQSGGAPLADNIRQKIEPKIGADLSSVKVHTDKNAVQLSQDLGAKAFTHGNHIFYGQGQSPSNLQLTAHEAVHTVQQGAVSQVQRDSAATSPAAISTDAGDKIRRKFGFEVEVPLFLTYTDPAAVGAAANQRNDAMEGSGGGVAWLPGSPNFEIKVDHNMELQDLATFEENNNHGEFPHGASIVELVTKPWNEFALTEKQVRARAKEMVNWTKAKVKLAKNGQIAVPGAGGYYFGSNMPGANTYQSTLGYIQATYGIKLSSIPQAFQTTSQANPNIPNPKKPTESVHANILEANRVAAAVMQAIRNADGGWDTNVHAPESNTLQGYITLLANYLLAGKGGGIGLAKNLIGQFFYKSDMGKMTTALPQPLLDRLDDRANGSLQALYDHILVETGRGQAEQILPGMGMTIKAWLNDVFFGRKDQLLANMKNEYSSEYGPDYLGVGPNTEASMVMENRELQYMDPDYASKKKKGDKQKKAYEKGVTKAKQKGQNPTKADLAKALAKRTDPKKYPTDKWADMFVLVYKMVKQLNSMGTTQQVAPII